jgi:hypothetical protein
MGGQAQVTSVEAIEQFRSNLILYLSKARPAIEEVSAEVLRTRVWVQNDQRNHWDREMRRRARDFEQAKAELFSARLSNLSDATAAQEIAMHKAQRAIREAEAKQQVLRKWDRELDNRAEPLLRQVEQLHGFLTTDMSAAVAFLTQAITALQAYAESGLPLLPAPTSAAEDSPPTAGTDHPALPDHPGQDSSEPSGGSKP